MGDPGVIVRELERHLLTHPVTPAGPIPTACDPDGVYPYVSYTETSLRPVPRRYRFVVLENERIRATVCPDLGGRVTSLVHKPSGREVLYAPEVVRPVRILPRFAFVAGGIEVSFPISHAPTQNETVRHDVRRAAGRAYVTCGEREVRFGMRWSVEFSLGPDEPFLTQRLRLENPGSTAHGWMSWSNAALPSEPDTEFHFPRGEVLSHSSRLETIDWASQGPRLEAEIREMTGYFWKTADASAFGAYTPSAGSGLYHVADRAVVPGMKLWSYGVGADREWAMMSSARRQPYVEIQGGPLVDQSIKGRLEPRATWWHVEHWIPTDRPMDVYALAVPRVTLRPIEEVPLFDWARPTETQVWLDLVQAHASGEAPPDPPDAGALCWAPSGMEDLREPFGWAVATSKRGAADLWRFHYGTWLAGRGETDRAIDLLATTGVGVGRVLLARLQQDRGNLKAARNALDGVEEPWLQLHPQVVVERDRLLRAMGEQTLEEREAWLARVSALEDEALVERRVQLLIDRGEALAAKELLLSRRFQRVHQSYTRTDLWRQVCDALQEPSHPLPPSLGEDGLARFGAYREFE